MNHLSAFALDALALGALDPASEAAARMHLERCPRCRADHHAAAELRGYFAVHVMYRTAPRAAGNARWWLLAPALAAAVALVIVLVGVGRERPEPEADLAIKGGASARVYAHRDDRTFAVEDGTRLAAGDRIRFAIVPAGAPFLLIASIDGSGAATIYYPYGGRASAPLGPAGRGELPGSIVLDAAPGPERVFALFSDEPLDASVVIDQLHELAARGSESIRATRALPIAGARAQSSVVFEKVAP